MYAHQGGVSVPGQETEIVATLCTCTRFEALQQPTRCRTVSDHREVLAVTVATKLPAHNRATGRIKALKRLCLGKFGERFHLDENFRHQIFDALLAAVENIDR